MKDASDARNQLLSSCLSVAVIAVFLILSATTFGWFASSENVDATGFAIKLDSMGSVSVRNVTLYRRDGAQGARIVTDDIISLPVYDTVFTDNNVNAHIIIRTEILGLQLQNGSYPTFNLVASYDNDLPWLDEEKNSLTQLLSNVVEIRAAIADTALAQTDANNAKDVYAGALELLGPATSGVFVSVEDDVYSKASSLTTVFSDYDDKVLTEDGYGYAVLFIEITYNQTLVQRYLDGNDIDIHTTGASDVLSFDCDLTSFYLKGGDSL
ncbi:MAG: hypothetical protein ACI4S9_06305 [Christensenellales bacterium]